MENKWKYGIKNEITGKMEEVSEKEYIDNLCKKKLLLTSKDIINRIGITDNIVEIIIFSIIFSPFIILLFLSIFENIIKVI